MTMTTSSDRIDKAFTALVDRYLERVYRYLRNLTRDDDAARDLAHEVFLRLRRQLDAGKSPSEAYVFTAARNTALSAWRRRQAEARKHDAAADEAIAEGIWCSASIDAAPSRAVERLELRQSLELALGHLPEDQRSVFLLSTVEGLKYSEIAAVMGIPPGTVASRKHQAQQSLRTELERMGHALP